VEVLFQPQKLFHLAAGNEDVTTSDAGGGRP
jgi:hypothetical protein